MKMDNIIEQIKNKIAYYATITGLWLMVAGMIHAIIKGS